MITIVSKCISALYWLTMKHISSPSFLITSEFQKFWHSRHSGVIYTQNLMSLCILSRSKISYFSHWNRTLRVCTRNDVADPLYPNCILYRMERNRIESITWLIAWSFDWTLKVSCSFQNIEIIVSIFFRATHQNSLLKTHFWVFKDIFFLYMCIVHAQACLKKT